MTVRKYIPTFLKYPLITVYILWRMIARGGSSKTTTLNLAGVLPPQDSGKIIHGGKVKLVHLRERFGDTWRHFNIAYLVSSGLPFAPLIWVRLYKAFNIKIVWNQNGVAYGAWAGEKETHINKLMAGIHFSDHVVYQSEFTKQSADKYLGEIHAPHSIIYNPVDTSIFTPHDLPLSPLMLLATGSHFDPERVTIPLEVLKLLRERGIDAKLTLVGRYLWPKAEEQIEQKISELGMEKYVTRTGAYLQNEAPEIYRRAHILLHLKYLDPCPTVVAEALSSGIPVIGSASGGMPELVDEKSGILIPIKNDYDMLRYPSVVEVAEAVIKIKDNYVTYRKESRERAVNKFDKKLWLDKHEEIFNSLLQ